MAMSGDRIAIDRERSGALFKHEPHGALPSFTSWAPAISRPIFSAVIAGRMGLAKVRRAR